MFISLGGPEKFLGLNWNFSRLVPGIKVFQQQPSCFEFLWSQTKKILSGLLKIFFNLFTIFSGVFKFIWLFKFL